MNFKEYNQKKLKILITEDFDEQLIVIKKILRYLGIPFKNVWDATSKFANAIVSYGIDTIEMLYRKFLGSDEVSLEVSEKNEVVFTKRKLREKSQRNYKRIRKITNKRR